MTDNTSLAPAAIGLLGVLVGGIITAGSNYVVAVRKEHADQAREESDKKQRLHQAARMIWVELQEAQTALDLARSRQVWIPGDTGAHARADSWDKYGSSLAAVMPFKDWENVAIAYAGIYTLRSWYHKDKTVELDNKGGHVENFNVVLNNVARALPSLEPYLKE